MAIKSPMSIPNSHAEVTGRGVAEVHLGHSRDELRKASRACLADGLPNNIGTMLYATSGAHALAESLTKLKTHMMR